MLGARGVGKERVRRLWRGLVAGYSESSGVEERELRELIGESGIGVPFARSVGGDAGGCGLLRGFWGRGRFRGLLGLFVVSSGGDGVEVGDFDEVL